METWDKKDQVPNTNLDQQTTWARVRIVQWTQKRREHKNMEGEKAALWRENGEERRQAKVRAGDAHSRALALRVAP